MPAAAVIPAPIAYTNVVAVKKLVVEFSVYLYLTFQVFMSVYFLTETFMSFIWRDLGLSHLL